MSTFDAKAKSALYWAPQLIVASIVIAMLLPFVFIRDIPPEMSKLIYIISHFCALGVLILLAALLGIIRHKISNKHEDFWKEFWSLIIMGLLSICTYVVSCFVFKNTLSMELKTIETDFLGTATFFWISVLSLTIYALFTVLILIDNHFNCKKGIAFTKPLKIIKDMFILYITTYLVILMVNHLANPISKITFTNLVK